MSQFAPSNFDWTDRDYFLKWKGIDRNSLTPSQLKTLDILKRILLMNLPLICTTSSFGKSRVQPITTTKELEWFYGFFLDTTQRSYDETSVFLSAAAPFDSFSKEGGIWVYEFGFNFQYSNVEEYLYKIFKNCIVFTNPSLFTITVLTTHNTSMDAWNPSEYGDLVAQKPNYFVPIFGWGVEVYEFREEN